MNRHFARLPALIRGMRQEQWFLLFFGLLLTLFVAVLFIEATSVGRGGR